MGKVSNALIKHLVVNRKTCMLKTVTHRTHIFVDDKSGHGKHGDHGDLYNYTGHPDIGTTYVTYTQDTQTRDTYIRILYTGHSDVGHILVTHTQDTKVRRAFERTRGGSR